MLGHIKGFTTIRKDDFWDPLDSYDQSYVAKLVVKDLRNNIFVNFGYITFFIIFIIVTTKTLINEWGSSSLKMSFGCLGVLVAITGIVLYVNAIIRTSWQSGNVASFVGQHPTENSAESFNVNRCGGALIHLKNNRAFVEYPSTTIRSVKVNGVDAVLTSYMRLLYRVEKISGEWKIVEMISVNEADELAPMIPNEDLKINSDDVKNLRVSYRWLAYVRKNAGGEISENLLGTDRPDEVKKIYDAVLDWLNSK